MAVKQQTKLTQITTVQLLRRHYFFIAAYIGAIVVFDTWGLIAREAIGRRWVAAGLLLIINTLAWYLAKLKRARTGWYQLILLAVIISDIGFVAYNVYWERGMASNSVGLFAVPLILASALKIRSALIAAASLCAAAYAIAAVGYFFDNYGEGYRVELYGTVGFYVAVFFIVCGLLLAIVQPPKESP